MAGKPRLVKYYILASANNWGKKSVSHLFDRCFSPRHGRRSGGYVQFEDGQGAGATWTRAACKMRRFSRTKKTMIHCTANVFLPTKIYINC